jgi:hypothetical protein
VHRRNTGESSEHSNHAPGPAFGDSNENVAVVLALVFIGPLVICVSGVLVSVTHAWMAGDASTLPARSCARTANEWAPSPIGPNVSPLVHVA